MDGWINKDTWVLVVEDNVYDVEVMNLYLSQLKACGIRVVTSRIYEEIDSIIAKENLDPKNAFMIVDLRTTLRPPSGDNKNGVNLFLHITGQES